MVKLSSLPKENGKVRYRGKLWEINTPVESDRPGKKKMVLARKGDEVRLIHFGDSSMKDYTQHENKGRRANYLARSAGIRSKDGKPTKDDPFSPNYWSRKVLWGARKDSMKGDTSRTALLERIDSLLERFDQRGAGVPCGKSWIPRGAKCSKEKARQTTTEARQRGAQKAREYNKLRGEVKASAGQKARSLTNMEKLNRSLQNVEAANNKFEATRAKANALRGELEKMRSPKNQDLPELEDLFIQADRVGNKYQAKGERDRFQQSMNAEVGAIANLTDKQLPDEVMEAIDFSGRRSTQRAIAYDQTRKALPVNPGTRIPGEVGRILGKGKKSEAEFEQAKRDIKAKQSARRSLETPAETVVAEVVGVENTKPTVGGAKKRINDLLAKVKKGQEADARLSAQMAGTALAAVQELASVRGEDLTPIELGQSAPAPMKKPRGSTKQRVNALLGQIKENQQKSSAIDAGFLTVAQVASNELAKEADEMAIAEMGQALEGATTKALPAAKKKRKSKGQEMSDRINNAPQRGRSAPKTIKGVSID